MTSFQAQEAGGFLGVGDEASLLLPLPRCGFLAAVSIYSGLLEKPESQAIAVFQLQV